MDLYPTTCLPSVSMILAARKRSSSINKWLPFSPCFTISGFSIPFYYLFEEKYKKEEKVIKRD